jgi:NAD(P)-dependent dehydrogenase (short-subunit alcohol dehydrogenase family)
VWSWEPAWEREPEALEREVAEQGERLMARAGHLDVLALDTAGLLGAQERLDAQHAGEPLEALAACVQRTWSLTREIATRAFLAEERGGRVIYIAPAGDGAHVQAARAGIENLARTLSVEWARHGVTAVTIAPGADTAADEVAALGAYLASPAGAYFSGCVLELGGPRARS